MKSLLSENLIVSIFVFIGLLFIHVKANCDCCDNCTSCLPPCPEGYSFNSTTENCEVCPIGYFCPPQCNEAISCPSGYYSNSNGTSSCTRCPAGYQCLQITDGSAIVQPCDPGFYSKDTDGVCSPCPTGYYANNSGSDSCTFCPEGFFCSDSFLTPTPCAAGTFSLGGALSCSECQQGFYTDQEGANKCFECPEGHSCSNSSSPPTPCPPGQYSSVRSTSCIDCEDGFYSNLQGQSKCTACPPGFSCQSKGANPTPCNAGFYSGGLSIQCTPCQVGEYVISTNATSCSKCPAGYQCSDPSDQPSECPPGSYSTGGAETCSSCLPGYYSNTTASTMCISCPIGYQCSNSSESPVLCPSGTHANGISVECAECSSGFFANTTGSSHCHECPAGYQCSDSKSTPSTCLAGSYSSSRSISCIQCSAGFYSSQSARNTPCIECPAGYSCSNSSISPVPCFPGTYSLGRQTSCTSCSSGYYSTNSSSSSCQACPAGFYCEEPHLDPVPCPTGTFSKQCFTQCFDCLDGYYSNETQQQDCKACPGGYACTSTTATICPAGTISIGLATECTSCIPGYTYNSSPGQTECLPCPAGYNCSDPSKNPENQTCLAGWYIETGSGCKRCPPGRYTNTSGSSSCLVCPGGTFCPDFESTGYLDCSAGTYSIEGSTNCTQCGAGFYQNETGQSSCVSCPAGYHCSVPSHLPSPCASGSYSREGAETCIPCESGTFQPDAGKSNCSVCPEGHRCTGTGNSYPVICQAGSAAELGSTECVPCMFGSYADQEGSSECSTCPVGHYCSQFDEPPKPCLPGFITNYNNTLSCSPCEPGTYSNVSGGTSCERCPVGHECPRGSSTPEICFPGSYSDSVGLSQCKPCEQGSYNTEFGQTSCLPCPGGFSCPYNNGDPISCSTGAYSPSGVTICIGCDSGSYTVNNASDYCTICPRDHTCVEPDQEPIPCPEGLFSPEGSTSCLVTAQGSYYDPDKGYSVPCDAGKYDNSVTCEDCPAGFYCTGFNAPPQVCVNETYQNETGQSACKICPAGKQCLNPATTPVDCTDGQFSPEGDSICRPCASGYFSGTGFSQCYPCPAGSSCSSSTNTSCPAGTYSHYGDAVCTSCADGEHTNGETGASTCQPCPAGFQCEDPASAPVACSDGEFSRVSEKSCYSCPAGFYCPDPAASPLSCSVGEYSTGSSGSAGCISCPSGQSCLDPSSSPINCDTGSYSLLDQATCTDCPAGFECLDATQSPQACNSGSYSLAGNGTCYPCPVGYFCVDPSVNPVQCAAGTTTNGNTGQTLCDPCPAGATCAQPGSVAATCQDGSYVPSGGSECIPCPAGSSCSGSTVTACTPGTYSPSGQSYCSGCNAGNYCPETTSAYTDSCKPGTYSLANASFCTVCPAEVACPDTDQATTVLCSSGFYSVGGQDSCTKCEAGQACPNKDGSGNFFCLPGTYSLAEATECLTCPAGEACPYTNSDTTITCNTGTYSGPGQIACTPCPAGYSCSSTSLTDGGATPCSEGSFSLSNEAICTPCPAGSACPSIYQDLIIVCPEGTYSEAEAPRCLACPPGQECPTTKDMPTDCQDEYFSTGSQTSCTPCPAGYQCTDKTLSPVICPTGQYSLEASSSGCQGCDAGYICPPGSGQSDPASGLCPLGYYCLAGDTAVTPCPAGTHGNMEGLASESECQECPAGYFCPEGTASIPSVNNPSGTPSVQNICPTGHYCPPGTQTRDENPCDPGTYNPNSGRQDSGACQACPSGRYCEAGSSSPGLPCPPGYYCIGPNGGLSDSNPPDPCPEGTFTSEEGSRSNADCADCPPGYFCPRGSSDRFPCGNGTFQPNLRQVSADSCEPCTAGMQCSTSGLSAPDGPCRPGHFCPLGTRLSTDNPCAAGTFTNSFNLTSQDECDICPIRFACEEGTGGTNKAPLNCAPGYFCKNQTEYPTQHPCPAGSYSNQTNLATEDECWQCPRGFYCEQNSTDPQGPCWAGYFCPAGTQSADQFPCPAGSYTNKTGNVRIEDCESCIGGSYCEEGSSDPTPCEPGKYNPSFQGDGPEDCAPCSAGYYCPDNGTTNPIPCGMGMYSDSGFAECLPCPPGYYCDVNTTSQIILNDKTCPAGMHCPEGTSRPPNLLDFACPAGFYCLNGATKPFPEPCPIGTFSAKTGLTSMTGCEDCTEGYYCDTTNLTAPTDLCPPGYWCERGTGSGTSNPCKPGTFLNGTAAVSSDSCTQCTSGYFCPSLGTFEPTICGKGYYCPPGANQEQPCTNGTYNNATGATSSLECIPCRGGYYCDGSDPSTVTGKCSAGYYCIKGSWTPTPVDSSVGDICPIGGYCLEGSASPQSCEPGFYSNFTMAISKDNCTECPPGKFCSGASSDGFTGLCNPGYYCVLGASVPTQNSTEPGYFSEAGASNQTACEPGTYSFGYNSPSCAECDEGQYCDESAMSITKPCPGGSFCPRGSIQPRQCPQGTYNDEPTQVDEQACNLCDEGSFCSQNGLNSSEGLCAAGFWCGRGSLTATPNGSLDNGGPCPPGHYCPAGTRSGQETPCCIGTYNNETHGANESFCRPCDPGKVCSKPKLDAPDGLCMQGYYCSGGARSAIPSELNGGPCTIGHYCPEGTGNPKPCEPGTYNLEEQNFECRACEAGYQCNGKDHRELCPPGYYCPAGTNNSAPRCPPGTFAPNNGTPALSDCEDCTGGFFCDDFGLTEPTDPCDAGYFCRSGVDVKDPSTSNFTGDGGRCPAGFYCPRETAEPQPCLPGTYLSTEGATDSSNCTQCDKGYYCSAYNLTQPENPCSGGFYCSGGATTPTPTNETTQGGYECPSGYHCPPGTPVPLRCSPGGYSDEPRLAECKNCSAGYYCPGNSTDTTTYRCEPGYYCPEGTGNYVDYPCPAGTYGEVSGFPSPDSCKPCDPGRYCDGTGSTTWTGLCDPGFYCLTNASVSNPGWDTSYIDPETCICPSSDIGGECPLGHFCPAGTGDPEPCTGGFYCDSRGLSNVSGICDAGHFCTIRATRPDPVDAASGGGICPEGYWCGPGTMNPEECPPGTFGNGTQFKSEDDCFLCNPGFYCPNPAQTDVTDACGAGVYCPLGTSDPTANQCQPGYKCPPQSPDQVLCESGFYQDETSASTCKPCEAGFYCDQRDGPITTATAHPCPIGSYCPPGTKSATEYLCLPGTYGSRTETQTADDCEQCKMGRFCPIAGLTENDIDNNPDYYCAGGYYCISGANISTPDDNEVTGRPCQTGHYCPIGTTVEVACEIGTFNSETMQETEASCVECTGGYYCESSGLPAPSGPCDPRFYCPGGNTEPNNGNFTCTIGHYCPSNTSQPIPCPSGSYNPMTSAESCLTCPEGSYCVDGLNLIECPRGFYCPNGTGYDWKGCEPGTYGASSGLRSAEDCFPCDPGKFCDKFNDTTFTGECDERFYCRNGSSSSQPTGEDGVNGPCSPGHYCPVGTTLEQNCPEGTYYEDVGLARADECWGCPAGKYCIPGSSTPTGNCSGGFYCLTNATDPQPPGDSTGGPCPRGFYCPAGTSEPKSCPPGRYNDLPQQEECFECQEGYFCPVNSSDYQNNPCPVGYFCPNATKGPEDNPCPVGTFSNETGLTSIRGCQPCPPGEFCDAPGRSSSRGLCAEGWYCTSCSWSDKPGSASELPYNETSCLCPVDDSLNVTGGPCRAGSFCPKGSESPSPCTEGQYCETDLLGAPTAPCDAGFYCIGGATKSKPRDGITGDICPMGHYCEQGSPTYEPCPPGTFSNRTENKEIADCASCTPGFFCVGGESSESGRCAEGFYCPGGQNVSSSVELRCTKGHRCPGGISDPIPCDPGTYQDEFEQITCKNCTLGSYCERGSSEPLPCEIGFYCPVGTQYAEQYGCPAGTYGNRTMLASSDDCNDCDGGMFCGSSGLSTPTNQCLAGSFCTSKAIISAPRDGISGDICPLGHYCPPGTTVPFKCDEGTYGPEEGLQYQENCTVCDGGQYCSIAGKSEPEGNCSARYYCPEGSTSATEQECPSGYHCPAGSADPVPCPVGSYTNTTLQSECSPCEVGSYCNGTGIQGCPIGYYCPPGTGGNITACPRGTYGDKEGLQSEMECKSCDPGYYCPDLAATSYEGECEAGYYCRSGSDEKTPSVNSAGDAGVCPPGFYCEKNTGEPDACPSGTFNSFQKATGPEFCRNCSGGFYCNGSGLSEETDICSPGYYCLSGASEGAPSTATETGGPCPLGHYCEAQSTLPKQCDNGSFANDTAMDACIPCPAGSFCELGAENPRECIAGHYCEYRSMFPEPCPNGTYNNDTGSKSADACQYCDPGYYCPNQGMDKPEGTCAPGWYCVIGSWMKKPVVTGSDSSGTCECPSEPGIGGMCEEGYYCPEGASKAIPCDPGSFCSGPELPDVSGVCKEGYYCIEKSTREDPIDPTVGGACPPGNYCPRNSSSPTPCPAGFYSAQTRNTDESDCELCEAGSYCPSPGWTNSSFLCGENFYCPAGSVEKYPPGRGCPRGSECPTGSPIFQPCYSGTHQPEANRSRCLVCPETKYCDYDEAVFMGEVGVVFAQPCPAGFFCPQGTNFSSENPCPPGTFGPTANLGKLSDCDACTAGMYCDQFNQTSPTSSCYAGYFCPEGSSSPEEIECPTGSYCEAGSPQPTNCPIGMYGANPRLKSLEECSPCDPGSYCEQEGQNTTSGVCHPGFYCSGNSTKPNPDNEIFGDICPPGSYCPANSSWPTPCRSGTYNPDPEKIQESDCLDCDPGSFCNGTGQDNVAGPCFEGYYCNGSSSSPTQFECPVGHQCPPGSPGPSPCLNGTYANVTKMVECQVCPEGFYCIDGAIDPEPCPKGQFCPAGSGIERNLCQSGFYNSKLGLSKEDECEPCPPGYYCPRAGMEECCQASEQCDPGFNCILGVDTNQPDNVTNKGFGGPCPPGHQCPFGVSEPCPVGSYADDVQFSSCDSCPSGFFCNGGTINPVECRKGYFCPEGTGYFNEHPCPAGTFNNRTGQGVQSSCLPCSGGWYCSGTGNEVPEDLCDEGYYCISGSDTPTPEVNGTDNSGGIEACTSLFDCVCPDLNDTKAGKCPPGYYCPRGTLYPAQCDYGKFCPNPGMSSPGENCSAGFYCPLGSSRANQEECTPGHYCEEGTGIPVSCPNGTFSRSSRNERISDCHDCTAGTYCEDNPRVEPTANCTKGFYCPGGDVVPSYVCSVNHFCREGSSNETVCPPGTHQPDEKQDTCIDCLPGEYCDPNDGNLYPEPCPQGYFCPQGTPTLQPCPPGTYGATTNLFDEQGCEDCPGGLYCEEAAAIEPKDECYAGYYCSGKASIPDAYNDSASFSNGVFYGNGICPIGYFCINGTSQPEACPPGTFSMSEGRDEESDCLLCPPGKYCDSSGRVEGDSAPDCDPGFLCVGGAVGPKPNDFVTGYPCPVGFYCPAGTPVALGCEPGTYSPTEGRSSCMMCGAGSFCPNANTSIPESCWDGYYCPVNSTLPTPCPEGSYNDKMSSTSPSDCLICPPGSFCNGTGNPIPSGVCQAGFLCEGNSTSPTPSGATATTDPYNGPCPAGHYCTEGATAEERCPRGTLRNVTGGASIDDCAFCTPGYYCSDFGMTEPTAPCQCGYYCPGNSSNWDPAPYECDPGFQCPTGSIKPRPCDVGYYTPDSADCECQPCQPGFFCNDSLSGGQTPCPPYSYCPGGVSYPLPCPNGTYTGDNEVGLADSSACTECPPGKYCTGGKIRDDCAPGYLCVSRSYSATANGRTELCDQLETCAGPCPAGSYCLEGTTNATACPENTLRTTPGASQESDCEFCPPGLWCRRGNPVPEPCPPGFYCQGLNTSDPDMGAGPQPCREHTFNNESGGSNKDDCLPCPAGFWCNDTGLSDYTRYACELGYYCVGGGNSPEKCPGATLRDTTGATSVDDCTPCTPGYYCPHPVNESDVNINGIPCDRGYECPEGSISPQPCTPGFYCRELTGVPDICPAGYYCPGGSYNYTLCEYPYYCPEGTGNPLTCDIGYQPLNISGLRSELEVACMICPAGSYRNSSLEDKCQPCPPGYYCPEGTGNYEENPCPLGHYCPEGGRTEVGGVTGEPIPCPPGTFGQQAGAEFSVCQSCGAGMYNNKEGQTACFPCGSSAESTAGATECTCIGFNRAFQASDGSCVCKNGYIYYDEVDELQSEGNSPFSCEALVDARCAGDEARIASNRACALPTTYSCLSACGGRGGSLNVDLGTCLCDTVTVPEEIPCYDCNTVGASLDTATGSLIMTVTPTNGDNSSTLTVPGVYGPTERLVSSSNTILLQMSPQGAFAVPPTSVDTAQSVINGELQQDLADSSQVLNRRRRSEVEDMEHLQSIGGYFSRRILQTASNDNSTSSLPVIPNPVICLQLGEMLIFNLYVDPADRTLSNYPVYVRNHLFNTNPNFDYGAFRQLEVYVTQSNWNISNFAHVFLQSGVMVFTDSQESGQEIVVNVLPNGLECSATRFQPATFASLSSLGVAKQSVNNLTPDWILIIVLLALFLACVIVLVIAVIVWRPRDAGIFPMKYWMPRYRALGEPYLPPHKSTSTQVTHNTREGLGSVRERGEAEGADADVLKDEHLLEDFNVRTLYDKLEDQNLHLASQLDKHKDSLQGFYEKINNQAEGLRSMLNKLDVSKLQAAELSRSASDGGTVINTTVQMGGLHRDLKLAGGHSMREKELLQSLETLINKLNTGKITVSDEVINDARNRLKGTDEKEHAKLSKSSSKKGGPGLDDWKTEGQESLIREQQSDMINLDRELISGEREAISNLLISHDEQRNKLISDFNDKLAFKTQGDLSEKEMEMLLAEHARGLEKALGVLSKERERQMKELKEQLAAKRRERANQLKQAHKSQRDDVGMPDLADDDDNKKDDNSDLNLLEKQLEAALLQESASASKEEEELITGSGREDAAKLSKSFDDELDAMVAGGLITDEVREQLRQQILEQENNLNTKMQMKRDMQIKAMRDRMAERKRRRMKKLEKKQEKEKTEAINEGQYTDEMKERHQAEQEALEAEMDTELASMERDLNESIESERTEMIKEMHKEIIKDMTEKHGVDPVAQQELFDRYRRELDSYDHVNNMKKAKHSQDIKAKLAARRARRTADVQRSAERLRKKKAKEEEKRRLEELARLREEEEAKEEEDDGINVPDVIVTDNAEIQALAREQERTLVENKDQQAAEADKLMHNLDKKEHEDMDGLERKLKEEKEKVLREASAKHEAEARARTDLSEEQIQQLLAAHQQELSELEESLEKQQDRQRAALQEKLAARRKRRTAGLRTRQEIEREREEVEQRKEMSQVQAKSAKEAERKAIIEGIERNGVGASERVIQKVLEKRHAQEMKELESEFALRKKMLIEEALKLIREKYESEKDSLLSKHEAELLQLENERLPTEEFERRKEELLKKQEKELKTLNTQHAQDCKEVEEAAVSEWKLEFAQAKLKLKEQHYQEFADALRELAPSANQKQSAEQAEESAKKLEETKQRLENEREAAEKKLAEERKMFEEEESRRIGLAMQEFEKEMEQETEQEKLKAERTLNTLAKRKEKLLLEKKNKMKDELDRAAAAGASEEEQKKILDQHEKDVENLTNRMDRERLRMKTQLEEKLKKRRKEKLNTKKQELDKESELSQKEIEVKQKQDLRKIQEKQVVTLQQTAAKIEKEEKSRRALEEVPPKPVEKKEDNSSAADFPPPDVILPVEPVLSQVDGALPIMPYIASAPSLSEKELHDMLSNSPLYHTLKEVQAVLQDEKTNTNIRDTSTSGFVGPDWDSSETELVPTPLTDLNTQELVAYKFGTFILTLLRTRRPSHPPVNLLVAEKVPGQPELKQNAFRGSFCFVESNAILYVKRDRLTQDSIGRLSLLLVHAMSHVAVAEFETDSSTAFLQEFYQSLSILNDDLFFARYKAKSDDGTLEKVDISQDLLDIRLPSRDVSTAASDSMRERGLQARIDKYTKATTSANVREELGSIEEKMMKAKESGTFDSVHTKLSSLLPPTSSSQASRRPPPSSLPQTPAEECDELNSEFISLSREAEQLHGLLNDGDSDQVMTVRNRLNNVQIKLSDVQKRLRHLH